MLCSGCKKVYVQKIGEYCSICNPRAYKKSRIQEAKVVAYLDELAYSGFIPMYTAWNKANPNADKKACGKARPDVLYDLGTHIVIVEVDEHQHDYVSYSPRCEQIRMAKITDGYRTVPGLVLPVHFIRFNPDAQKVGGVTTKTMFPLRMAALRQLLVGAINSPDYSHRVTISKLFYDITDAGMPADTVRTTRYESLDAFEDWIDVHFPLDSV
jgi:hypothetical protein